MCVAFHAVVPVAAAADRPLSHQPALDPPGNSRVAGGGVQITVEGQYIVDGEEVSRR
ncbi:hypothetical protein E2C01_059229 [Portunus trituberculatus]|uniref:Uncharacterized protein n=1 Tax=Portunus trituberculatus TaxID=210409 RepID=A0A5B7H8I4_PORTR|nr:hypothetical protein [Portunus trituberculatus]